MTGVVGLLLNLTVLWFATSVFGLYYLLSKILSVGEPVKRVENVPLFRVGGFESDILLAPALARSGYRIREVAISYTPRSAAAGKKIKYRNGAYAFFALLIDYMRSGIMNIKPSGN